MEIDIAIAIDQRPGAGYRNCLCLPCDLRIVFVAFSQLRVLLIMEMLRMLVTE